MSETLSLGGVLNFDSLAKLPDPERNAAIFRLGNLIGIPRERLADTFVSLIDKAAIEERDETARLWLACLHRLYLYAPELTIGKETALAYMMKKYWALPPSFLGSFAQKMPVFLESKKYIINLVATGLSATPTPSNKEKFRWLSAAYGCPAIRVVPEGVSYEWLPALNLITHNGKNLWVASQEEQIYILTHLKRVLQEIYHTDLEEWMGELVVDYSEEIGDMVAHAWVKWYHAKGLRHHLQRSRMLKD